MMERVDSEDRLVFTAGSSSTVTGFSHESHEIVDVWTVGEKITSMDSTSF
jgi:microtubule-associated protein-like 5